MITEDMKAKKFTFGAEILPKNNNTDKLIKIREEQEATRKAKEDAVSKSNFETNSDGFSCLTLFIFD